MTMLISEKSRNAPSVSANTVEELRTFIRKAQNDGVSYQESAAVFESRAQARKRRAEVRASETETAISIIQPDVVYNHKDGLAMTTDRINILRPPIGQPPADLTGQVRLSLMTCDFIVP